MKISAELWLNAESQNISSMKSRRACKVINCDVLWHHYFIGWYVKVTWATCSQPLYGTMVVLYRNQDLQRHASPCPPGSGDGWEDSGIIWDEEGLRPTQSRGEKETDAALILQLNTECLDGRLRFPPEWKHSLMKFETTDLLRINPEIICGFSQMFALVD